MEITTSSVWTELWCPVCGERKPVIVRGDGGAYFECKGCEVRFEIRKGEGEGLGRLNEFVTTEIMRCGCGRYYTKKGS